MYIPKSTKSEYPEIGPRNLFLNDHQVILMHLIYRLVFVNHRWSVSSKVKLLAMSTTDTQVFVKPLHKKYLLVLSPPTQPADV